MALIPLDIEQNSVSTLEISCEYTNFAPKLYSYLFCITYSVIG